MARHSRAFFLEGAAEQWLNGRTYFSHRNPRFSGQSIGIGVWETATRVLGYNPAPRLVGGFKPQVKDEHNESLEQVLEGSGGAGSGARHGGCLGAIGRGQGQGSARRSRGRRAGELQQGVPQAGGSGTGAGE